MEPCVCTRPCRSNCQLKEGENSREVGPLPGRYKSPFLDDLLADDAPRLDFAPGVAEGNVRFNKLDYLDPVPCEFSGPLRVPQEAKLSIELGQPLPQPSSLRGLLPGLSAAVLLLSLVALVHWMATRWRGVALPSEPQIDLLDLGISQLVSYDVEPFARERNCAQASSPDCLPASKFNPTELSTDQWVETAVAFGAKEVCMTAHHDSGFAFWPTEHNMGHTVKTSPYKKDVLREFVRSCVKRGVRICYYWGPNANGWLYQKATPSQFLELQHRQLSELLADYGPVSRLVWDHYSFDGTSTCLPGDHAPCPAGTFPSAWQSFVQQVRRESPRTLICPGPDCLGHQQQPRPGTSQYPVWLTCKQSAGSAGVCDSAEGVKGGDLFMLRETAMTPLVSGWFQSGRGDEGELALNAEEYWANFLDTVGVGLVSSVNAPPGTTGLIPAKMAKAMAELGRLKRPLYEPLVSAAGISGDCRSVVAELQVHAAFNAVVSREDLRHGQRIAAYVVEVQRSDGSWEELAPPCRPGAGGVVGCVHGISVGAMVVDLLGERPAPARLRWRCLEAIQDPVHLRSFAATHVQEPPTPTL